MSGPFSYDQYLYTETIRCAVPQRKETKSQCV